jgi:hypothetical protein
MSFTTNGSEITQVVMKNAAFSFLIRKFSNTSAQIGYVYSSIYQPHKRINNQLV